MIIMKASDKRFPAIAINPGFREDALGKDLDNTLNKLGLSCAKLRFNLAELCRITNLSFPAICNIFN